MKRRRASIIENNVEPFRCVLCGRRRRAARYVRIFAFKICWQCARAVYRRLAREVSKGSELGLKLQRIGRPLPKALPRPALDIEEAQLIEGRARAMEDREE
jgi:hypothetical protein